MIDLEFLESLIRSLDRSSLDTIEVESGGTRIRLSKSAPSLLGMSGPPTVMPQAAPPEAMEVPQHVEPALPPASDLVDVKSPMVGTFYRSAAPDAPPYVEVDSVVSAGDTLCIIEAMKLMNELESEIEGRVVEILVENAEPVEYGQVLFKIDPAR